MCLVLVTLSSVQALEKMLLEGKETRELYEIVETDDFIEFFDNEDMSDFGRALQNAAEYVDSHWWLTSFLLDTHGNMHLL